MRTKFLDIIDAMTKGLFSSLIIGTVLFELSHYFNSELLAQVGTLAKFSMGPLICLSIARRLKLKNVTQNISPIIGFIMTGSLFYKQLQIGDPLLILIGSCITLLISNFIERNRIFDMFIIPALMLCVSPIIFSLIEPLKYYIDIFSDLLNSSIDSMPLISTVITAIVFSFFISGPLSSAALATISQIDGQLAFIAVIATCSQMSSFFIMGYKSNGFFNSLLVLFGSSKLQLKNIISNKFIFLPALIASVFTSIIALYFTDYTSTFQAAGMGNCALIGPLLSLTENGFTNYNVISMLLLCFIIPMIISFLINKLFINFKFIKDDDFKL